MSRILDVYFHNVFAGKLVQNDSGNLSFQYDLNYCSDKNSSPLSVSMPIRSEAYENNQAKAFFSGFLPDDIVRERLARYLGISEKNPFALLEQIGGECAGAVSLYPEGQIPSEEQTLDTEVLDDHKLREIFELLKRRPLLAGTDDLRLSLAGAQNKIAVGIKGGKIALIKGTTPTSHILKPLIADMDGIKGSVHNEFFCMQLAIRLGIEAPHTEIRWLNETPYFLIERYDRIRDKTGTIKRLHQEDFCQALSIVPELKYEREGGPSIAKCLDILQKHSSKPAVDYFSFLNRVIFNYLIGNADAHGKNFSLLYKGRTPVLAPAYDMLCTAAYPTLSSKMAMKIGGKYEHNYVFLRHWHSLVPDTASAKMNLEKRLAYMSNECLKKASELKFSLKSDGIQSTIFDDICSVIKARTLQISS